MTKKTKQNLITGGTLTGCAALAIIIAMQFAKPEAESKIPLAANEGESKIKVAVFTTTAPEDKPEIISTTDADGGNTVTTEPPAEYAEYIEIDQSFTEATTPAETAPPPPVIEDEAALTDPDNEPTYAPEQVEIQTTAAPSSGPKHGDVKDGKMYVNGFGWVAYEGENVEGYSSEMYENGNKIGHFG